MYKRITILRYQTVESEGSKRIYEEEDFYNTTPDKFRKQMYYLKENGYTTITPAELLRSEREDELPQKPILLTFDVGHISNYDTVLPILKEVGFTGVFFLVVNDIGKEYRVNWEQVRALKDTGMTIGSRSMNNIILNKSSYPRLIFELKASKVELEENLGGEVLAFSIPRGLYSQRISDVARGMGYKLVFTSFVGNVSLYSNPYRLRRIVIRSSYSMKEFISIVRKDPIFLLERRLEQFTKNRIKSAIGIRGYDWVKDAVFRKSEIASPLRGSQ